jgi:hypothetical protein
MYGDCPKALKDANYAELVGGRRAAAEAEGRDKMARTTQAAVSGTAKLEAVLFNAFDTPLGAALEQGGHRRFHLAGRLEINSWGGRSKVQLRLEDAAYAQD